MIPDEDVRWWCWFCLRSRPVATRPKHFISISNETLLIHQTPWPPTYCESEIRFGFKCEPQTFYYFRPHHYIVPFVQQHPPDLWNPWNTVTCKSVICSTIFQILLRVATIGRGYFIVRSFCPLNFFTPPHADRKLTADATKTIQTCRIKRVTRRINRSVPYWGLVGTESYSIGLRLIRIRSTKSYLSLSSDLVVLQKPSLEIPAFEYWHDVTGNSAFESIFHAKQRTIVLVVFPR